VEEYLRLREAVDWGRLDENTAAVGLVKALFSVCLLHQDEVIGLAE
jgi:hypothetical protein